MDFLASRVNFKNKGAELMMYSILDRVQQWDAANKVAVNLETGTFKQRNQAGVHHHLWKWFWTIPYPYGVDAFNFMVSAIPASLRDRYKLILESEIDCVMDASGFAYSDQWGEQKTQITATLCKRWQKSSLILLVLKGPKA